MRASVSYVECTLFVSVVCAVLVCLLCVCVCCARARACVCVCVQALQATIELLRARCREYLTDAQELRRVLDLAVDAHRAREAELAGAKACAASVPRLEATVAALRADNTALHHQVVALREAAAGHVHALGVEQAKEDEVMEAALSAALSVARENAALRRLLQLPRVDIPVTAAMDAVTEDATVPHPSPLMGVGSNAARKEASGHANGGGGGTASSGGPGGDPGGGGALKDSDGTANQPSSNATSALSGVGSGGDADTIRALVLGGRALLRQRQEGREAMAREKEYDRAALAAGSGTADDGATGGGGGASVGGAGGGGDGHRFTVSRQGLGRGFQIRGGGARRGGRIRFVRGPGSASASASAGAGAGGGRGGGAGGGANRHAPAAYRGAPAGRGVMGRGMMGMGFGGRGGRGGRSRGRGAFATGGLALTRSTGVLLRSRGGNGVMTVPPPLVAAASAASAAPAGGGAAHAHAGRPAAFPYSTTPPSTRVNSHTQQHMGGGGGGGGGSVPAGSTNALGAFANASGAPHVASLPRMRVMLPPAAYPSPPPHQLGGTARAAGDRGNSSSNGNSSSSGISGGTTVPLPPPPPHVPLPPRRSTSTATATSTSTSTSTAAPSLSGAMSAPTHLASTSTASTPAPPPTTSKGTSGSHPGATGASGSAQPTSLAPTLSRSEQTQAVQQVRGVGWSSVK